MHFYNRDRVTRQRRENMNKLDEAVMIRNLRLNTSVNEWNAKTEDERIQARKKREALTRRLGWLLCTMTDDEWIEYRMTTAQ